MVTLCILKAKKSSQTGPKRALDFLLYSFRYDNSNNLNMTRTRNICTNTTTNTNTIQIQIQILSWQSAICIQCICVITSWRHDSLPDLVLDPRLGLPAKDIFFLLPPSAVPANWRKKLTNFFRGDRGDFENSVHLLVMLKETEEWLLSAVKCTGFAHPDLSLAQSKMSNC